MQIYFIALLEFLYNNLITVGIIFTGFLLLLTSARLIYLEYKFNHNLNLKKILFGDRRPFKAQSFSLRRVLTFTLGFILLLLIGYQAFGNPITYQQNTKEINTFSDALEIYESFSSKFYSDPFSNSLITPRDDISFENNQADSFSGFDFVLESRNQIFVLNQDGVQVLLKSNNTVSYQTELSFETPQCALESLQPKGLAIFNNLLFVLSTESIGQCNTNPLNYALRDNRTHISVYETDSLEKVQEYEISGHLNDAHINNQQIILLNSTWIPFANDDIVLNNYLPFYIENDLTIRNPIDEILYIEKTDPNTFVTATKIDYLNNSINQSTILTDYQNQIDITRDSVIIALDAVNFNQASDLFELSNPIRSIDTAIVQFNIFDEDIYYFRTQVLEGNLLTTDAVHHTDYGLRVFTKTSSGLNNVYSLSDTLRYVNKTSLANRFKVDEIVFENNYFYINYVKELSSHYIYLLQEETIELVATQNESTFFDSYTQANGSKYISVQQFDNNKLRLYLLNHFEGSSLYNIDIEVEFAVSNIDFILDPSDLENVIYIEDEDTILVPAYLFTNNNLVISENEIALYNSSSDKIQSMILGPLGQFKNPFSYRVVVYGNVLVHITPGGYRITDINNIEEALRTIYFANQ